MTKEFLLPKTTLLEISKIFTEELDLGLALNANKKSSLLMANTYVTQLPDGTESGDYVSLDLGTTNFRVVLSKFRPNGKNEFEVKHYTVPTHVRRGESKPVNNFLSIYKFS